jgi:C-terminal processing protease CtpA/Prc
LVAAVAWLSVCCFAVLAAAADRHASFSTALESISTEQLQGLVGYLADDALEGREAGSRGGREAGQYLAARLGQLGLTGAGVEGGYFQPFEPGFRNVLGLIEGGDPELRQQYVIVGAHYDHVGYGSKRNSRGPVGRIHNGADDNASGTSGLLEMIEAFVLLPEPPRRSILFAFWDAEEKGLLGSKHWARHPTLPLSQVVVTLNVDMIGRLRDDRLSVYGTRSGYGWRRLLSQGNAHSTLRMEFPWELKPNGDHWPFFDRGISTLMLSTGLHDDYHRPSDDAELINAAGMQRVSQLIFAVTYDLANLDAVPGFREAGRRERDVAGRPLPPKGPQRPERLGVQWRKPQPAGEGVVLSRVTAGSPADEAGLEPGDRIIEFAGRPVRASDELLWDVTAAENPVSLVVRRLGQEEPLGLEVQLAGRPLRLGITWRSDDAEPGAVILTEVVPGSPAARAGLQTGDHVYQIADRDFADEIEFGKRGRTTASPIRLLVERDGQLRTVVLHLESPSLEQAA